MAPSTQRRATRPMRSQRIVPPERRGAARRGRAVAAWAILAMFGAGTPAPSGSGAKCRAARICGVRAEDLLDAQELVVLGHAVRAGRRARLDLTAAGGHGEVGDRGVLGLPRAVRH